MPGAGKAEAAVRAAGAWDEARAPGAVTRQVIVYATITAHQIVRVKAASEEAARDLAKAKAVKDGAWDYSRPEIPDIDEAEVLD